MCPLVDERQETLDLSPDEVRRKLARERMSARLSPGCRVFVVKRRVELDSARDQREYTLHKLALWKRPSSDGPKLARDWRVRKKDPFYRDRLQECKGPVLVVGDRATVVALLPSVQCELTGSRPWAFLLSDSGLVGWCYALDGLEILAPAGEAT